MMRQILIQATERVATPLSQAPAHYGLSRSAIYRAAREGKVELVKSGRTTLVIDRSIRAYIENLPRVTFVKSEL